MKDGAKYYKSDFQIHSPRDQQFKGKEYITDEDRASYSDAFIKACRAKDLDAVAITDHHDLWFYKYIKEASYNEKDEDNNPISEEKRIIVFPGIELTLAVPCQAILLFDEALDLTDELIIQIYTKLGITDYTQRSSSKTGQTNRLNIDSISKLSDSLDELPVLKNKYIIFPNVKDGGSFSILRPGMHIKYKEGRFVGGYLDGNIYAKHIQKLGWANIINGKVDVYGNRQIAVFQTSDCRSDSFDELGTAYTWIKFAEPTAEGIRQSCIAKQSRVSQAKPSVPDIYIEEVAIKGSTFFDNISVRFNSQLNVIIGGRGTGKSSVLSYINYALGIEGNSLDQFIVDTLQDGNVDLSIVKGNVKYILRKAKNVLELKIADNQFEQIDQATIEKLFHIDSYTQKELSKHGGDRLKLINKIVDFSIQEELDQINIDLSNNASQSRAAFLNTQKLQEQEKQHKSLVNQRLSAEKQVEELKKQLINVNEQDRTSIEINSIVNEEEKYAEKIRADYSRIFEGLHEYAQDAIFNIEQGFNESFINIDEIQKIKASFDAKANNIKATLILLAEELNFDDLDILINSLHTKHVEQRLDYEQAKGRLAANRHVLNEIEKYDQSLVSINSSIQVLEEAMVENLGARIKLYRLLIDRDNVFDKIFEKRKAEAARLSTKAEGCLEIIYIDNIYTNKLLDDFMQKVKSSKNQDERTDNYFKSLIKSDSSSTRKNFAKFWYALLVKKRDDTVDLESLLQRMKVPNNDFLPTDFDRILSSLTESDILDFVLKPLNYNVKMLYYREKGVSIPFKSASYGQQAGAIINILLNQTHGPLIIDQPEDDLDNKVVHQITERINATKQNRQLIFASHNANIAVNGDAELIVHFEYNPETLLGEIAISGAIDSSEIKTSIKDIMEGGELALKMRFDKYGF